MKALFRHAHAGVHHEHRYVSHMLHSEKFWVGIGIALLIGLVIALAINSSSTVTPPRLYFPYY